MGGPEEEQQQDAEIVDLSGPTLGELADTEGREQAKTRHPASGPLPEEDITPPISPPEPLSKPDNKE